MNKENLGLNPLSIGSVFPTFYQERLRRTGVLIPFLSGLFFQPRWNTSRTGETVLIPFLSGLFFQHELIDAAHELGFVLIPFLSGLFFQRRSAMYARQRSMS